MNFNYNGTVNRIFTKGKEKKMEMKPIDLNLESNERTFENDTMIAVKSNN